MSYHLLLPLILSLLHTTSSTVYHVIPDDHYTTNNNTYTLQHYLNNIDKYFTSHTQLHFLPGQYYLNTDLIIQHVSNLSLIGNRTNEVINSVIKCTSPAGIAVVGSSDIVIANIVMDECGSDFNESSMLSQFFTNQCRLSLLIVDCWTVTCSYFYSTWQYNPSGIRFINGLGNIVITNVASTYLSVWNIANTAIFNEALIIHLENFRAYTAISHTYAIDIQQSQSNVDFKVTLLNTKFRNKHAILIRHNNSPGQTTVKVVNCSFSAHGGSTLYQDNGELYYNSTDGLEYGCNHYIYDAIFNYDSMIYSHFTTFKKHNIDKIQFINCSFLSISSLHTKKLLEFSEGYIKNGVKYLTISIINCLFHNNYNVQLLSIESYGNQFPYLAVFMKNVTVLSNVIGYRYAITADKLALFIENIKIASNSLSDTSSDIGTILGAKYSYVQFSGYNEFSLNDVIFAISSCSAIYLQENTVLNFTLNNFQIIMYIDQPVVDEIDLCAIQYISDRGNLDNEFQVAQKLNYSIVFINNTIDSIETLFYDLMHCTWDLSSAFLSSIPLHVNQRFITSNNFELKDYKRQLCLCDRNGTQHCDKGKVGPFYPGQTISPKFSISDFFINFARIEIRRGLSSFICGNDKLRVLQLQSNECKALEYTIKHNKTWCELVLTVTPFQSFSGFDEIFLASYTILLLPCPAGFSLHPQGYCQCDPILPSNIPSLTVCDIDHQTIPRPGNTWISAHTINNSHSYHVSLHCPFDYCLPHSSQLNLSTPDSQCQFNRSGVLCGQCQHGLSTVFGSSQCKRCSSIFLSIIIPFGIAGVLLILLLFALNLTVTNGDVNPFLLYINIVSINAPIFFTTGQSALHAFVSFANLDLGIETCFYNGMDDYTKMWLQLVFPMYLIFIATLLIITSRYSTTIQRLTARRALPVLATLFLLSYTKVLLTVSNVLFSYTSITHLPSNHTTLVWSVDTSVPLFGVKFTILFIACLILFLILVPFNVVLIFTKKLSYFKVVTYFKPLLDAYQGPYKIKFHYWTGLQLLMRTIFFGLSALNRNVNLLVSSSLLGVIIWLHEKFSPYNCKLNNIMEALSLLNLNMIFVASLYTTSNATAVNISVSLAMLQLLCIILLHVKELLHGTVFKKAKFSWNIITLFNTLRHKVEPNQSHPLELTNPAPEAACYNILQEPLIGHDN